jgi:hypothetical protein
LQLTWHPGKDRDDRQTVDIEFCVEADGTRVTLIHSGWEMAGVQARAICASYSKFVSEQMIVLA